MMPRLRPGRSRRSRETGTGLLSRECSKLRPANFRGKHFLRHIHYHHRLIIATNHQCSYDCIAPRSMPLVALVFFVTFSALTAFVVLSLFLGQITLGMIESLQLIEEIKVMSDVKDVQRMKVTHTWRAAAAPFEDGGAAADIGSYAHIKKSREISRTSPQLGADGVPVEGWSSTGAGGVIVGEWGAVRKRQPGESPRAGGAFRREGTGLGGGEVERTAIVRRLVRKIAFAGGRFAWSSGESKQSISASLALLFSITEKGSVVPRLREPSKFLSGNDIGKSNDDEGEAVRSEHLLCFTFLPRPILQAYLRAARLFKRAVLPGSAFEIFMMALVVMTAVLMGMETVQSAALQPARSNGSVEDGCTDVNHGGDCVTSENSEDSERQHKRSSSRLTAAQDVIIGLFCAEICVKMVAEGAAPQRYFYSSWNAFGG